MRNTRLIIIITLTTKDMVRTSCLINCSVVAARFVTQDRFFPSAHCFYFQYPSAFKISFNPTHLLPSTAWPRYILNSTVFSSLTWTRSQLNEFVKNSEVRRGSKSHTPQPYSVQLISDNEFHDIISYALNFKLICV